MKKLGLALLGATALAFTGTAYAADMPVYKAPPAPAQQPVSGYIGFEVGAEWWDWKYTSGTRPHGTKGLFGGEARVNWWLNPTFAVQFDLEFEAARQAKDYGSGYSVYGGRWNGALASHWAWRDPNRGALGVFIAAEAHGGTYFDYGSAHDVIYGIDGQLYYGNLTLYGQVGGLWRTCSQPTGSASTCYATPKDGWFVRGVPRYFFTPNDEFSGEIGWFDGKEDYNASRIRILNWGLKYQHKFDNMPVSFFVEYAGFRITDTYDSFYRWNSDILKVGFNLWLNQPTLIANDRNGATFDLPKFIRALPYSCLQVDC